MYLYYCCDWSHHSVKYSLANNMGQGKNPTVPSQSDAPEESDLWTAWQLFPLDDDQTCHSKDGGSEYSVGQLWEEIAGAWRRVHISAWEFDGNIRPTNWTEDNEIFRCSRKVVPSFSRPSKSPGLIDERFVYLSWLLLLHTSVRRENKYILLYILRVVVCLVRAKRNNSIQHLHPCVAVLLFTLLEQDGPVKGQYATHILSTFSQIFKTKS